VTPLTASRPRLLDLFCGAGGAAMGYHRAGFDVVGVDNRPQPRYPFEFHQADAMTYPLDGFDVIHASPPCTDHSVTANFSHGNGTGWMLGETRKRLTATGLPWVIENVPGAPMRVDYQLCGCMFALRAGKRQLIRERWFETSWHGFDLRPACHHTGPAVTVTGGGPVHGHPTRDAPVAVRRVAMGIDWMTGDELSQAIPPAYTEYIGRQLLAALSVRSPGAPVERR
jgi:DNA (cytosine-5)-methyltransferase 1